MQDIICQRVRDINKKHLELILDVIDYERQYYVKIMRNPQKFKNIVVNECVRSSNENVHSESFHIYGKFISGVFKKTEHERISESSVLEEDLPAAALKHIRIESEQGIRSVHEIVIYQPKEVV